MLGRDETGEPAFHVGESLRDSHWSVWERREYVMIVFEEVDDDTVILVTAYEVPEPA